MSSQCEFCCKDGICKTKSDCESSSVETLAFVAFVILLILAIIGCVLIYFRRKNRKNLQDNEGISFPEYAKKKA